MVSATSLARHTSSRLSKAGELVAAELNDDLYQSSRLYVTFIPSFYRRRFDLQNPSRTERNVEMFGAIERALIQVSYTDRNALADKPIQDTPLIDPYLCFVCLQNNSMSLPVVYLDPVLDQDLASRLTAVITKHQVKSCRVVQMSTRRVRLSCLHCRCELFKSSGSIKPIVTVKQIIISAAGSQFVRPQGTLTEDHSLASHHIYPLAASTEEGQLNLVHVPLSSVTCPVPLCNLIRLFPAHLCSDEWMRPVMRKDKHVLVHWGMHPDR